MSNPLPLDEAVAALKRDPTHAVVVQIDDLTVEMRAVEQPAPVRRSAADVFGEIGRWEGEAGEALDALFAGVRQTSNRRVPELP